MPQKKSIILVDDHEVVRNGLKELIELLGDYRISAQYNNGKELSDNIAFAELPDLILLDMAMPIMDGEKTLEWLKNHDIQCPVIVLTVEASDKTIISLYKLGVRGYLQKDCSANDLRKAISNVLETGYHHNEFITRALQRSDNQAIDENESVKMKVTKRELDFLKLVCDEGEFTYEQIADKIGVSRRTVDGYREALFEKFNIKSKTGLVLFAIKHNLL